MQTSRAQLNKPMGNSPYKSPRIGSSQSALNFFSLSSNNLGREWNFLSQPLGLGPVPGGAGSADFSGTPATEREAGERPTGNPLWERVDVEGTENAAASPKAAHICCTLLWPLTLPTSPLPTGCPDPMWGCTWPLGMPFGLQGLCFVHSTCQHLPQPQPDGLSPL